MLGREWKPFVLKAVKDNWFVMAEHRWSDSSIASFEGGEAGGRLYRRISLEKLY